MDPLPRVPIADERDTRYPSSYQIIYDRMYGLMYADPIKERSPGRKSRSIKISTRRILKKEQVEAVGRMDQLKLIAGRSRCSNSQGINPPGISFFSLYRGTPVAFYFHG